MLVFVVNEFFKVAIVSLILLNKINFLTFYVKISNKLIISHTYVYTVLSVC